MQNFFTKIRKYEKYNSTLKAVKSVDRRILMKPDMKISKWMEYFKKLLNGEVPENPDLKQNPDVPRWEEQSAEPEICEINQDEN